MIELTNEVFNSTEFVLAIQEINKSTDMPAKTAYRFNRISKLLMERAKDYEEIRIKLIEKYGDPDPNNEGQYIIKKDEFTEFSQEFTELRKMKVHLEAEKIEFPENLKISPAQITLLEDIFDFSTLN